MMRSDRWPTLGHMSHGGSQPPGDEIHSLYITRGRDLRVILLETILFYRPSVAILKIRS